MDANRSGRMPVGFVGHGNPLNVAIEAPPRAVARVGEVVVQAERDPDGVRPLGGHPGHDRTHPRARRALYDFWGFPEFMYRMRYPALARQTWRTG
ncbi:MAG: hypothetical protein U0V56_07220 [Actinomycetota bacterium]